MPRQLLATAVRTPEYQEYEIPDLQPNQVRVKAEFGAFKHGTEMIEYRGMSPFKDSTFDREWGMFVEVEEASRFPQGLGNQIVGEVTEVGSDVATIKVGDRVNSHGSLKEICTFNEAGIMVLPDSMSWQASVCFDPLCFAVTAVRDGQVRLGDNVAVFGMGAIGLMIVQCAKQQGAERVIAFDPIPRRRELALKLGADEALDSSQCDAGREVRAFTEKKGADVCLEVSGNYHAMHHAIRGVAFGGNVVAVAYPKACTGGIDFGREAHFNRPNLIFARGCSDPNREHPRWSWQRLEETSWRMLCDGRFQTDDIVDPIVPFDEALEAWKQVDEAPQNSIKLGVKF
ncbi:MAG: zinc-binding alcohol dehydrogenase [Planctomycetota bacterium]|nr:zinc-binding alcohol dehydrogenase [Planctomycetota bacterium]